MHKQLVTNLATVPYHLAPVVFETQLGEQASGQTDEPERAASKEPTEEPTPRRRALTPSYIPEKGPHQTWPAFGFKSVSKEGALVLRHRTVKIDDSEEAPSKTTPMRACGSKGSRAKGNRRQKPAEKYANLVPRERMGGSPIEKQTPKRTWQSRFPSLPNSLKTRQQAAVAKATDNCNSAVGDGYTANGVGFPTAPSSGGQVVETTAVQGTPQLRPLILDREDAKCPESVRGAARSSPYS